MTDYNDGEWHGWDSEESPVDGRSEIEWVTRSEIDAWKLGPLNVARAAYMGDSWADIIAFRVIKAYREPREFWLCLDTRTEMFFHSPTKPDMIEPGPWFLVREVIE